MVVQRVEFSTANAFVEAWHRHSGQDVGHLYSLGLFGADLTLHGVAITGRPKAKARGYQRIVTYTLATETGASVRASGFTLDGHVKGRDSWRGPGRARKLREATDKTRWVRDL